ncbi:MAG TPA: dihydrolipoamide acetyltransferase family protein [Spirochaetia bacterium]|nr:dihydrolipoamide acetyltransferase family protein [Spirochaetales bacterium]HRY79511.1 dihydrolipoamide acetyltransferase family protein [Spirochaetia bacterium]HRZ90295.1 dihydrolipoamide acetyltransferase family protein [Spirochaetia bacterium]
MLSPRSSEPLSGLRKVIADRLSRSKREAPHAYFSMRVDMGAAADLRRDLAARDRKVSYNDLALSAAARALVEVPGLNGRLEGETLSLYDTVNLGMAVSLEKGLIVPVLAGAERLTLVELADKARDLAGRARLGKLKLSEYSDGTFTVSNLGMFGVGQFAAVINPPELGILAVGAVTEEAVARDGVLTVRPVLTATLSVDHRAVDGALGGRWLAAFRDILQAPRERLAVE